MAIDYLFVYGTLLKDSKHDMAQFLEAHSECLGDAYFNGKLYMVSWFPGAVLSDNPSEKVYGRVFKLNKDPSIFEALNDYEGVGEHYPEPNLYRKERVTAYLSDGSELAAWVYIYNLSVSNLKQIASGKFFE
ncbi:gamma-glutamylcyclotransferase [Flavobacteriaceae bacterium GSB9]|nr:gamma-glutamylcyclotransferase [Flavobacteriaceae bacterium GSB9]